MAGDILGEGGGGQEWEPVWIGFGVRVVIQIGLLDGYDGSPEVINVFGIPGGDATVRHCNVEQREETRVLGQRGRPIRGNVLRDLVPMARRRHCVAEVRPE